MNAIETNNLTRQFKNITAVKSLSLTVKQGEIFGLLGPNGAGKTTLISMLTTLLKPTNGSARVNGYDIRKNASKVRSSLGLVFQESVVMKELSALDNLDFHARVYNVSNRRETIQRMLSMVDLTKDAKRKVEHYSGGMKRRLELIRGLLHEPTVLFLDEPTLGLDPATRRVMWDYLLKLKQKGNITIFLTTHYMDEADALCDRVAIIDKGEIKAIGTPTELKQQLEGDTITIEAKLPTAERKKLQSLPFVISLTADDNKLLLVVKESEKALPKILHELEKSKVTIESLSMQKPTLEDVFLKIAGRELRDE